MFRELIEKDSQHILDVVNTAAKVFDGKIPADCYHQPYMSNDELHKELKVMTFYGWEENGKMVAVMGSHLLGGQC